MQETQPQAIGAAGGHGFVPVLVGVHAVIREHTVKIHDEQAHFGGEFAALRERIDCLQVGVEHQALIALPVGRSVDIHRIARVNHQGQDNFAGK